MKYKLSVIALTGASMLAACGGGGGATITSDNPIKAAGLISGLGSIVLNGVRYETIGATTQNYDDKQTFTQPLSMGMTVSVTASSDSPTAADAIYVESGISGQISNFDSLNYALTIAGIPVFMTESTVIQKADGSVGSLTDVGNDLYVETYGLPQTDGSYKATRVEIKSAAQEVKLLGIVNNLDAVNRTFTIGSDSQNITVTYNGIDQPRSFANGDVVSVETDTTTASTQYAATSLYVRTTDATVFERYERDYKGTSEDAINEVNELYGVVSRFSVSTNGCALDVQGVPTQLSSATLCSAIKDGDYIEVKGVFSNGVLNARRVEFETARDDRSLDGYSDDLNDIDQDGVKHTHRYRDDDSYRESDDSYRSNSGQSTFEIYGSLACVADSCTLTSNGVQLDADLSTATWEHQQIQNGFVEAKGYLVTSTSFKVLKIELKD